MNSSFLFVIGNGSGNARIMIAYYTMSAKQMI